MVLMETLRKEVVSVRTVFLSPNNIAIYGGHLYLLRKSFLYLPGDTPSNLLNCLIKWLSLSYPH